MLARFRFFNNYIICLKTKYFREFCSLHLFRTVKYNVPQNEYSHTPLSKASSSTMLDTDIVKCSTPWDAFCCRSY
jgi:hypothetical protein